MEQQNTQQAPQGKTNILAILGFIFSFIMPLLGLIFCIIALVQINKDPSQQGKGLAIAGLIISILWLIVLLLLIPVMMMAYFGVLSPNKLLPSRTTFQAPLPNIDTATPNVEQGTIEIPFRNSVGSAITLPGSGSLTVNGQDCNSLSISTTSEGLLVLAGTQIPNGGRFIVTWSCPALVSRSVVGSRIKATLSFDYINVDSGITKPHLGVVESDVR